MSKEENEGELKKRIELVFPNEQGIFIKSQLDESKKILLTSIEDAKKVLGVDLQAVVNSFGEHAVSSEVRKFTEDFVLWFGSLENVREKSS